jgi:lactate racemase
MRFRVPYGRGAIDFELPAGMRGQLAVSRDIPALSDPVGAIQRALHQPVGSAPLRRLAKAGDRACIVFTDATRASPDHLLMPALLCELEKAGVHRDDITLLCGVGMHRPSTHEEKVEKLGQEVVDQYRVLDHSARRSEELVDLGITPSGVPLSVNKVAYEADLLIATGLVEPHQYAGYSGGRKTLAVGAAGEKMIEYTHGPAMVDHPGTRLGRIEGNPFHEAVTEAALRAGLTFIVNVVLNDADQAIAVCAGEPTAAFAELVSLARSVYEVPVDRQFDVAIGGVGYPKDANLYQASRAASYLYFAPTPVVREGGILIVPARCQEGVGDGIGEKRYLEAMREAPDVATILREARTFGYKPGQQRAFVMAKVLEKCDVIIVGSEDPQVVRDARLIPAETMEEALATAASRLGARLDVLVVPHALRTLPIVSI